MYGGRAMVVFELSERRVRIAVPLLNTVSRFVTLPKAASTVVVSKYSVGMPMVRDIAHSARRKRVASILTVMDLSVTKRRKPRNWSES